MLKFLKRKRVLEKDILRQQIQDTEFVVFDTELTGINFKEDSIISIGAVKMKGGRIFISQTYYTKIKPITRLKPESIIIHGITPSELEDSDDIKNVLLEFLSFIGKNVLVGYFVYIDMIFLTKSIKKYFGKKFFNFSNFSIDIYLLQEWLYENDSDFRKCYPDIIFYSDLYSIANRYGIEVKQLHNAFYDAYITAQIFQRFIGFLFNSGIETLEELLMIGKS